MFASTDADGHVSVWSLVERQRIGRFDTTYEFGEGRLALIGSAEEPVVLTGNYTTRELVAYDGRTGSRRWRHDDLGRVQVIRPVGEFGQHVAVGNDAERRVAVLDGATGELIATFAEATKLVQSPFAPIALAQASKREVGLLDTPGWERLWTVRRRNLILLGLGTESALVTEFNGSVRLVCLGFDGKVIWESASPIQHLAGGAAWDPGLSLWVSVHHPLDDSSTVVQHHSRDGDLINEIDLGWRCMRYVCLPGGGLIATGHGHFRVLDAQTAETVWDYGAGIE